MVSEELSTQTDDNVLAVSSRISPCNPEICLGLLYAQIHSLTRFVYFQYNISLYMFLQYPVSWVFADGYVCRLAGRPAAAP